jgi:fatty-acid desaturase
MAFIDRILQPPSYGWQHADGSLVKPSPATIFKEFFSRLNIFKTRKNWLPFLNWIKVLCLVPFAVLFFTQYFSWWLFLAGAIYGMIMMGTHGTIWHHRYCTHGAYTFSNNFWRFFTRNLSLAVIPEETYTISHHVHHAKSDQPGDPYCAEAGFYIVFWQM